MPFLVNMPKTPLSQQFLKALDDTFSREEATTLLKGMMDFLRDFKKTMLDKMAQHSQSLDQNHQSHMGEMMKEMKENGDKMSKMVTETKDTMRSESRTVMRYIDQKVNDLRDEMPEMPDMDAMHEEMRKEMSAIEAKIPTLPPEKNIEGMLDELQQFYKEELEKLRKEMLERIAKRSGTIGGVAGPNANAVQFYDLSSQCNGSTTSFYVPTHRVALMLVGTQSPIIYRPTTDFTTGRNTLDLVTAQVGAPQTGQSLIFLYVK